MCQHLLPKQRWLPENSYTHLVVSLRNLDEMISYTATDVAVYVVQLTSHSCQWRRG